MTFDSQPTTYLLYIDTSSDTGTVAISRDEKLLAYKSNTDSRNHAAFINGMIDEVLAEAGISLQQLNGLVVCAGPGSYTGLRIGMATAKGLCYVLDKPLFLHNKLTLLCWQQYYNDPKKQGTYTAILTAREKEYFISAHDNNFVCIVRPQHILSDKLNDFIPSDKETLIITDNDFISQNLLNNSKIRIVKNVSIIVEHWIIYALEDFKCNISVNLSSAEPFYLKQVYTHK